MQKTKGGINNQFLITGFSIKFNINPNFPKKIDPPKGRKERKREKIENEGKKGKKSTRVREFSSTVSRVVYMYYERQKNRRKREKEKRIKGNQVLGKRQTTRKPMSM